MVLHLNWSNTSDWTAVRARLRFLGVVLYGNFAEVADGDCEGVKQQLEARGFKVTCEPYFAGSLLLRLTEGVA